jgi:fumarate reductase subunit C
MPIFWWLGKAAYVRFIVRELTSLAVAYASLFLLTLVLALGRGSAAYDALIAWCSRPWVIAFHGLVLLALLFHTVTWLGLAPKALVVRLGGRRVPDGGVVAAHYLAWAVASALVVYLLWGG